MRVRRPSRRHWALSRCVSMAEESRRACEVLSDRNCALSYRLLECEKDRAAPVMGYVTIVLCVFVGFFVGLCCGLVQGAFPGG